MLCKLFTPWDAEPYFADRQSFLRFLQKKQKRMNVERIVLFAMAFLGLMFTYASDLKLGNYVAVGALVIAVVLTLLISKCEKVLAAEEKTK